MNSTNGTNALNLCEVREIAKNPPGACEENVRSSIRWVEQNWVDWTKANWNLDKIIQGR